MLTLTALGAAAPAAAASPDADLAYGKDVHWELDGVPELAALEGTVRSVLSDDHIQYHASDGQLIDGFFPGSTYISSQGPGQLTFSLYIRDTATILPMARYYYPRDALRTSVEEFARLQYPDGSISATIGPDLQVDKATVTSDEETSFVLSASAVYSATADTSWLTQQIAGQSMLERLNRAMSWILTARLDPATGLVKRGHTTDWGDVKIETDGDPTHMQPGDQWTVSIYDQAIAYAALQALADMNDAVGHHPDAQHWRDTAQQLRGQTNASLWQPDRGFYRIHLHLQPDVIHHDFDEGRIVAIGNAAAVYYGLADGDRVSAILTALERTRVAAGAAKVGLSLDPPYTGWLDGEMAPHVYQNGALWDWWAGRQITGEFQAGYQSLARKHLFDLARDWATHPGIVHEWESPWAERDGVEPGYAGAAAVVGQAVVEGLFGITMHGKYVDLAPRLGERSGKIRVYQPVSDLYAAYRYQWTPSRVSLAYGSNTPNALGVRVPVPWSDRTIVRLDGKDAPVTTVDKLGEDTDLFLIAPNGTHVIDLLRVAPHRREF